MERKNLLEQIKKLCDLAELRHSQVKTPNLKLDTFCSWKVLEVVLKEADEYEDNYTEELLKSIIKEYSWLGEI